MNRPYLSSTEAAEYLQTTRKNLYHLIQRGLPHRKMGVKLLFFQHEIDAWLDQLPGVRPGEVPPPQERPLPILQVQAWQQPAAAFEMPLVRRPQPPKIPYRDS